MRRTSLTLKHTFRWTTLALAVAALACEDTTGPVQRGVPAPPTVPTQAPRTMSISPATVEAGSADLTLALTGTGFVGGGHARSRAVWSAAGVNTPLTTRFISRTRLTAVVPAALLSRPATSAVFVKTGDPVGNGPPLQSGPVEFTVTRAESDTTAAPWDY